MTKSKKVLSAVLSLTTIAGVVAPTVVAVAAPKKTVSIDQLIDKANDYSTYKTAQAEIAKLKVSEQKAAKAKLDKQLTKVEEGLYNSGLKSVQAITTLNDNDIKTVEAVISQLADIKSTAKVQDLKFNLAAAKAILIAASTKTDAAFTTAQDSVSKVSNKEFAKTLKAKLNQIAIQIETDNAEAAVKAYETAPIVTSADIAKANALEIVANNKVQKFGDRDKAAKFSKRMYNKKSLILKIIEELNDIKLATASVEFAEKATKENLTIEAKLIGAEAAVKAINLTKVDTVVVKEALAKRVAAVTKIVTDARTTFNTETAAEKAAAVAVKTAETSRKSTDVATAANAVAAVKDAAKNASFTQRLNAIVVLVEVTSVNDINVTKNINDDYILPAKVTVTLGDGTNKDLVVTWDKVADTKVAGEFNFTGTLTVADPVLNTNNVTVKATLTVVDNIAPAAPVINVANGAVAKTLQPVATPVDGVTFSYDLTNVTTGEKVPYTGIETLVDAQYKLVVTATRTANNLTTATGEINFTIDNAAPDAPKANVQAGVYNKDQAVTLSAEDGAKIYYTIDGTTPSMNSTLYSGAINVTDTTTVRAVAIDAAGNVSGEFYAIYSIDKVAPTIEGATDGQVFAAGTVTINLMDQSSFSATLDGNIVEGNTITISSAGLHDLKVTDAAGNTNEITFTIGN